MSENKDNDKLQLEDQQDIPQDFVFEEDEKLNPIQMIVNVFVKPDKAFRNLATFPNVLLPILIIVIGFPILGFLIQGKEQYIQNMINQYNTMGVTPPTMDALSTQYYTNMLVTGLGPLIFLLFKGFIVSGIGSFVGGEVEKFKETYSVLAYAYLPVFLGQILISILALAVGNLNIHFSLAVLMPNSMAGTFWYTILQQFDIFVIWYQILAIIGISYMYKLEKKLAAIAVLLSWITWILIYTGVNTLLVSAYGA
ncbi:Yip1 family protein [Abyssisolibacter fermentans]|uniref:Yip1 family protein n=1 Tax=Abyssisolibacter fermentans TaxID=1766203 RepID=UPI00138EED57|nr:Yip1 family protein [Abyssisolibacter fermentans]